ncbi:PAS domain S-box protein [Nocardioides sp. CER19]|uniref:PAS domain S-box protein n=1 Tax=Nocardioides sp. CER19 TaxID=3038538 RepID=UPI002448F871|nr:PAS domain S-box protein [Nocardioides sp. CER19]MDH2413278.1 PAS domain S-box protein [Nocardioides sp. CER19]
MTDGTGQRGRPTLVIVDDSEEVRAIVRTGLESSGLFEIVGEGADGAEAIAHAYRLQPDLLLLDTSMPTMDGLEALPAILTLSPETRVVIYTGFEERGLADRAREYGAADFIEKSTPIRELPARLWRVLGEEATPPTPPAPRGGLRVVGATDGSDPHASPEQEVLDEHLERFREVFEQAAIGMATLTLNGSVVRANAALARLMECDPRELVGVDYGVLMRGHGDLLDDGLASVVELGRDLVSFEHPLPVGEEPGTVRVTLAPVRDSKSQPLYVFAQVEDISGQRHAEDELRRSEERFRLLVTAVSDYAIFMLDPIGHVVSWNAGARRIKGYTGREIIGRHFRVFYPPEEQAAEHPEHNLELALRDGSHSEEGWRVRRDGSRFWASVVITAVHDATGRHVGFAKVTRDQTEQQQAIEHRAHLLAVTAHELRSPAAAVGGAAALLAQGWDELDAVQRTRLLGAISASAERLHRLAADLGTASRLQSDTLALETGDVSLPRLLVSAAERAHVAARVVDVSVDAQDVTFSGDSARLGQALDNLLENAARYGRAPVAMTGTATDSGVRIEVRDSGAGVPAELVPRLFERFAAGPQGGTGLGLYLVSEIASRHGGQVSYRTPATFVIDLPA